MIAILGFFCFGVEGALAKFAGVGLIAGGVYAAYWGYGYNRDKWPALYARWDSSWLCNKCGAIYEQKLN